MEDDESKLPGDEYMWDDDSDYNINKLPCKGSWRSHEELLAMAREVEEAGRDDEPAPTSLAPLKTREEMLWDCVRPCEHEESHEEIKPRLEQLMGDTVEKMLERGKAVNTRERPDSAVYNIAPPPKAFIPPDQWLDEESGLSPREIRALKNRKEMILKAIPDLPRRFTIPVFPNECVYDVLVERPYAVFTCFGLKHLYNELREYTSEDTPYDSQEAYYFMDFW